MSTQQGPPSRPWFRLATMIRPQPPPPPATPTSPGPPPPPPPPRPAFIRPAFAPTATKSTPNPQPIPIPPPPQPNPTPSPSPPVPATNGVAPTASDLPVTKPSSPQPPQSSGPNTPPSQQSAPPQFAIVGSPSPPQAPQSLSPITTTTTTGAVTPPSSPSKIVQQISSPPLPAVTPPATSPRNIQKISFSAPSPKSTAPISTSTTPPSPQSAPPLEIFTSPVPAPQSIAPSPSPSPVTTTHTLTPPKVVKPLEPVPAVNVATPPGSTINQKFPFPAPPTKTRLIPSPPSSPPRPPPVLQQSEHPLPVSASPQFSPPHTITLPEKTSPTVNPLSPHLEYKQKTMHVPETKEKPNDSANVLNDMHIVAGNTHSSKLHDIPRKPETYMKHQDSEVIGNSVVTITGDNKGAIMRLTPFGDVKHDQFGNNRHNLTSSSHGETLETALEAKKKHQNSSPLLKTSFLNSNVQGVNNSILYNCSINHHDPGIHLSLLRKFDHGDCGFLPKEHKKG